MSWAVLLSLALHAAVIMLAVIGLPWVAPPVEPAAAVQVRLVSPGELEAETEPAAPPPVTETGPELAGLPPEAGAPDPGPIPETTEAPRRSDRIAPEAQPEPPQTLPEGAVLVPPERQAPDPQVVETLEPPEPQAPEQATTETVPDPEDAPTDAQTALQTAPRPAPRPVRAPAPPPEPAPEPAPAAQTPGAQPEAPADPVADAIAAALAGAGIASSPGTAPTSSASGPPLTAGERDTLRLAVSPCWNFSALSTEARTITVTLAMDMQPNGMPVSSTIRLLRDSGGSPTAVQNAFDVARRAIIRCQRTGYPLPPEKFDQWRQIEMTFNPERMRLR